MKHSIKISKPYNPLHKLANSILRKALFKYRDAHYEKGLPSLTGLINEYISIDIMVDGVYDINTLENSVLLLNSDLIDFGFDTLIDIGANIGNHSIYLSKYFNRVISFEPNPFTYELLKLNASLVDNVEHFNIGLSSKPSSLFISEDPRNLGGSQVYESEEAIPAGLRSRNVTVKKLDDLDLGECGKSVLIKIDIEGHELDALRGAAQFITYHKPVIFFEQHLNDFVDMGSPVLDFLGDYNYEFFLFKSRYDNIRPSFIKPILKLIFGDFYSFEKIDNFEPDFYDSIIAINKNALINKI